MKISAFRITNFRSLVDSDWVPFSPDGITVFVGQNESGKTSVLEALYLSLSNATLTDDDRRIGAPMPIVRFRVVITAGELQEAFAESDDEPSPLELVAIQKFVTDNNNSIDLTVTWEPAPAGAKRPGFVRKDLIESEKLGAELKTASNNSEASPDDPSLLSAPPPITTSPTEPVQATDTREPYSTSALATLLWNLLPLAILFNEESGRLPNYVDIDEKGQPTGQGSAAALNFLQIADIDLPALLSGDRRARENTLNRANARVSEDFNSFWSQTIGKANKLSLKCELENYSNTVPEKAGKPHLVFWICDGNTQLYPKQRSQGVRWFVSFYLQLKASEKKKLHRIFLLDEPGANLHSKAQGDVLKVINKLGKETSTVIYSTHSPQMLEYPKLFRVHAVQRDGEQDDSPSIVIDAHRLGTASTDTLSPVLSAMGVDLSNHQVIRKTNNVLLEEMSGYYYLASFWKLTGQKQPAHFIAATGVNKVEALANMFVGWGLEFIIVMDDDKQGREAYKSIKRELFGDDEELTNRRMLKIPGCPGIEDAFSQNDFKTLVLKTPDVMVAGTNAEFLKASNRSKPVLAFQFALAVERTEIKWETFDKETQERIKAITDGISRCLPPEK